MNRKTFLIIGVMVIIMVFGAVTAFALNTSEKKNDTENHECTPEMMEDMAKNCPEQMMKSRGCENMMKGEGQSGMMGGSTTSNNAEGGDGEHCGDMDSGMDSMMGSRVADKKGMM